MAVFFLTLGLTVSREQSKIDPDLMHTFETKKSVDIMIVLSESTTKIRQQIVSRCFNNPEEKRAAIYAGLKEFTDEHQSEILEFLKNSTSPIGQVRGFWIINQISGQNASLEIVKELDSTFHDRIGLIREATSGHTIHT